MDRSNRADDRPAWTADDSVERSVPDQNLSMDAAMGALRIIFGFADVVRRTQAEAAAAFGLGPSECAYRIAASGRHWQLRDYGDQEATTSLLIVAAPIKRPYIWDLAPSVSAIRYCLLEGLHVYLLEWLPASPDTGNCGLDECAHAIAECVATMSEERGGSKPFLIGHSLGGTLAAIYAATAAVTIRGLVLLAAPLCFQPGQSQFRDALVFLLPPTLSDTDPFPGSLLSQVSALASPGTFIWSRVTDAVQSLHDRQAMEMHARIERWTLDEIALPGKLVREIVEWLYRDNQLCRGTLQISGRRVTPSSLSARTLTIVNMADEIAPLSAIKPFIDAMPDKNARIIEYQGEAGVCLQHLGILVGRQARAKVWPEIIAWLKRRAA
jgi:polyhydroxyalkanoate synthase subunit PhaC